MKIKTLICLCSLLVFGGAISRGQSPTEVQNGRAALASGSLSAANQFFKDAVTAYPADQEANALYAVSRMLVMASMPETKVLLDKMGISSTGRTPFAWEADGRTPPASFSTDQVKVFAQTVDLVAELTGVVANLEAVTSPRFELSLSEEETGAQAVNIDYADLLVLRALGKGIIFSLSLMDTLNTNFNPATIGAWFKTNLLTLQKLLSTYPKLLTPGNLTNFAAFKDQFAAFANAYIDASDALAARPVVDPLNPPLISPLFELDPEEASSEAEYRATIEELLLAIQSPDSATPRMQLFSAYLNSGTNVRAVLPAFKYNHVTPAGFVDPTFRGALPGFTTEIAAAAFNEVGDSLDRLFNHRDDTVAPTVTIRSPKPLARIAENAENQVIVSGSASDNVGITRIKLGVEKSDGEYWDTAVTGSNSWSATVRVAPGINTVRVIAYDAAGNSRERKVSFTYVKNRLIQMGNSSGGKIAPLLTGSLELAKQYRVIATPAPNYIFEAWYDSPELNWYYSTNPILVFKMEEGYQRFANFIPNPFPAQVGTYNTVLNMDELGSSPLGLFALTLTAQGTFSGKVVYQGVTHNLVGKFDGMGNASFNIPRKGKAPLQGTLWLDVSDIGNLLDVWVQDGETALQGSTGRYLMPETLSPKYVIHFGPDYYQTDWTLVPQGYGYATATASAKGSVRLAGKLADGTAFTYSAKVNAVAEAGEGALLPVYLPLYNKKGSMAGSLNFGADLVDGALVWKKAAATTGIYPDGFTADVPTTGSSYFAPSTLDPWLVDSTYYLSVDSNGPAGIADVQISIGPSNRLTIGSNTCNLTLSLNPAAGKFKGTFLDNGATLPTSFSGVFDPWGGSGFYLQGGASGGVYLDTGAR